MSFVCYGLLICKEGEEGKSLARNLKYVSWGIIFIPSGLASSQLNSLMMSNIKLASSLFIHDILP